MSYSRWSLAGEDILLNSHLFLNIQNRGARKRGKKKQIVGKMKKHNALKVQRKTEGAKHCRGKRKSWSKKWHYERKHSWLIHSCAVLFVYFWLLYAITKPLCLTLCPFNFVVPVVMWFILHHSLKTISNEPKCTVSFLNTFLFFFLCLEGWKITFALELVQNLPPTLRSLEVGLEDSIFWLQASKWDPKGKHL